MAFDLLSDGAMGLGFDNGAMDLAGFLPGHRSPCPRSVALFHERVGLSAAIHHIRAETTKPIEEICGMMHAADYAAEAWSIPAFGALLPSRMPYALNPKL